MLQKGLFTVFVFSIQIGVCFCQKTQTYIVPFFKDPSDAMEIDVKINNLPGRFIFDSGATMVSFDKTFYNSLLQNTRISSSDIRYRTKSRLADGTLADAIVINLKNLSMGNLELYNIDAMVLLVDKAPLLIGQSVLKKFSSFTIDNDKHQLILIRIIPASIFIENVNYVPCSVQVESELEKIKNSLETDDNIEFKSTTIEQNIPTNPNALKKIVHKVTVRYFDLEEASNAIFIQEKLMNMGYAKDDVFVEDMTPRYPEPIKSYIEIWLK